jgi:excisionase family DNA binding protein
MARTADPAPALPAELLTCDEVAQRLRLSRRATWSLAATGKIASYRVSRRAVRFDPADVARYLASTKRE